MCYAGWDFMGPVQAPPRKLDWTGMKGRSTSGQTLFFCLSIFFSLILCPIFSFYLFLSRTQRAIIVKFDGQRVQHNVRRIRAVVNRLVEKSASKDQMYAKRQQTPPQSMFWGTSTSETLFGQIDITNQVHH